MCRAELVFRLVYFTGIFCLLYATDTLPNQQNTPYPSRSSERYGGVLLMDADRDRGGDTFPKHPAVLPSASRYIGVSEYRKNPVRSTEKRTGRMRHFAVPHQRADDRLPTADTGVCVTQQGAKLRELPIV